MNSQYSSAYSSSGYASQMQHQQPPPPQPQQQQHGLAAYSRSGTSSTPVHDVTSAMNSMNMYGQSEMEGGRRGQQGQGNGGSHGPSASLSSYGGGQGGGNGWSTSGQPQQGREQNQGRRSDDYSSSGHSSGYHTYGDRSSTGSGGAPLSPGMPQSAGPYGLGGNNGRSGEGQGQAQSQAPLNTSSNGNTNMGYMRGGGSGASGTSAYAPLDMQAGYPGPPGGMPSLPNMMNLNLMAGAGQPALATFASNQSLSSLPSAGSINSLSSLTSGVTPGGMSQRMLGGLLDDMGVSTGQGAGVAAAPHPLSQGMSMHSPPGQGLQGQYLQQQQQQQGPPAGLPPHNVPPMSQYGNQVPPTQIGKDDIIPTAIVIKNIPFAVQKETLLAVIESLSAPLPYAFNYHHDNGVFRGLAFANFRHPQEADAVVVALNGYDISGRKLRVEYKKVLQAGEKERIEREKAIKRMRSMHFDKNGPPPPPPNNGRHNSTEGQGLSVKVQASQNTHGGFLSPSSHQTNHRSPVWSDSGNAATNNEGNSYNLAANGTGSSAGQQDYLNRNASSPNPIGTGRQQVTSPALPHSAASSLPPPTPSYGSQQQRMNDYTSNSLPDPRSKDVSPTSAHYPSGLSGSSSNGSGEPDRGPSPSLTSASGSGQPAQGNRSVSSGQAMPTSVDFNDPVALDIYSRVLVFKEDRMRDELSFSKSLSARERRIVHLVAQKLGLWHYSIGDNESRYAMVTRFEDRAHALKQQAARGSVASSQSGHFHQGRHGADGSAECSSSDDSTSTSPGLRIKKSMPNLNLMNGPTVSRDPSRLIPKRSSGNLREYSTIGGSRRNFAGGNMNNGSSAGQTFNALFGAPVDGAGPTLGNGTTFEPSPSPTSPTFNQASMGPPAPSMGSQAGGLLRNPRGPSDGVKGFGERGLRNSGSNNNLRASGNGGGFGNNGMSINARPLSSSAGPAFNTGPSLSMRGDSTSIHSGSRSSSVIEEEIEDHVRPSGRH